MHRPLGFVLSFFLSSFFSSSILCCGIEEKKSFQINFIEWRNSRELKTHTQAGRNIFRIRTHRSPVQTGVDWPLPIPQHKNKTQKNVQIEERKWNTYFWLFWILLAFAGRNMIFIIYIFFSCCLLIAAIWYLFMHYWFWTWNILRRLRNASEYHFYAIVLSFYHHSGLQIGLLRTPDGRTNTISLNYFS